MKVQYKGSKINKVQSRKDAANVLSGDLTRCNLTSLSLAWQCQVIQCRVNKTGMQLCMSEY